VAKNTGVIGSNTDQLTFQTGNSQLKHSYTSTAFSPYLSLYLYTLCFMGFIIVVLLTAGLFYFTFIPFVLAVIPGFRIFKSLENAREKDPSQLRDSWHSIEEKRLQLEHGGDKNNTGYIDKPNTTLYQLEPQIEKVLKYKVVGEGKNNK
jgi:hypothetical protein